MPRNGATFTTSREIPASVAEVFAAFADPDRHARWWGPAGFSNTFKSRDFRTGGQWSFTMHGPDGHSYENESSFAEVDPPSKVVIEHRSNPRYRLTILLEPSPRGTLVSWSQAFESEKTASRLETIVGPGNEQNLDRLAAEVDRVR